MAVKLAALPMILGATAIGATTAALPALLAKKPKGPTIAPPVTRDDALEAARRDDELRRRTGSAANIIVPDGAGEASTASAKSEASTASAKTLLGE